MFTLSKLERDNFHHLYGEILWYGIFAGSSISFWGVYAAHLGASPFQVGLLISGPGLINLLLSLPAVFLLENTHSERVTFFSSIFNRIFFVVLVCLPWFGTAPIQLGVIIGVAFISAIPGTLLTISANLMLVDVIPSDWRATVIGRRFAILSISITVSLILSGFILDQISFPLNYQIVFGLGIIGAALSSYHLGKVFSKRWIDDQALLQPGQKGLFYQFKQFLGNGKIAVRNIKIADMLHLDLLRGTFGKFMGAYLIFYCILYIPMPVYTLFLVNTIKVSDGVISLGNSFFYIGMTVFSLLLAKVSRILGHHKVLVIGAVIYILYPLLGGLAQGPLLFYIASLFGGIAWGLANGALINRLFERTPGDKQAAGMALHNLVLNIGMLVGVLFGAWIAEIIGLRDSLLVAGGMRVISVLFLVFWG
jgi:MFS family permease